MKNEIQITFIYGINPASPMKNSRILFLPITLNSKKILLSLSTQIHNPPVSNLCRTIENYFLFNS
jgi:hypothetical protein